MKIYWILDKNNNPISTDETTWCRVQEQKKNPNIVARTKVGKAEIATVFMGFDSFGDEPPPFVTTLIYDQLEVLDEWEYATREDAIAGHYGVVRAVRSGASKRV